MLGALIQPPKPINQHRRMEKVVRALINVNRRVGSKELDESFPTLGYTDTCVADTACACAVRPEGQAFVIIACTRGNAAVF